MYRFVSELLLAIAVGTCFYPEPGSECPLPCPFQTLSALLHVQSLPSAPEPLALEFLHLSG